VLAKEALVAAGRKMKASVNQLAELLQVDPSSISRRHNAANLRLTTDPRLIFLIESIQRE